MLSLAVAKVCARLLSDGFAFVNKDALVPLLASQFLSFRKVLFVLLLRASSHVTLSQQPPFVHFLFRFSYTQDMCSLGFGIVSGTSVSAPS